MTFAEALRHEDTVTLARALTQTTFAIGRNDPATQTRVAVLKELARREQPTWARAAFGG